MLKLADRLRGLRGTENQTAFAARLGLKQAIYSHYETGRKKPSLEVLANIALTLHTTTDYLLGLSDESYIPCASAPSAGDVTHGANSPIIQVPGSHNTIAPPSTSSSPSTPKKRKNR